MLCIVYNLLGAYTIERHYPHTKHGLAIASVVIEGNATVLWDFLTQDGSREMNAQEWHVCWWPTVQTPR